MCPQEHLANISRITGLSFVLKIIGPLAAIIITLFYLLALYLFVTIKILLLVFAVKPCVNLPANTFCSSLGSTHLLIERTTIDPLYLWVISDVYDIFSQHITQVIHNRGHDFSKRFNPAGVHQSNHTRSINPLTTKAKNFSLQH